MTEEIFPLVKVNSSEMNDKFISDLYIAKEKIRKVLNDGEGEFFGVSRFWEESFHEGIEK